MRRTLIVLIAVLTVSAMAGPAMVAGAATPTATTADGCEYPIDLEDSTGEQVTIDEQPESIVALHPSDAQKVFKIGADDRLDGMPVSQYTEALDVDDQTDITEDDGLTPIPEEIIALEPDIVLAANIADEEVVDQLREAGIEVYVFDAAMDMDDVIDDVETAGQLAGACDGADVTTEWMDDRIDLVETAAANESAPLTLYPMGDGFTPGAGTFQDQIMTTAGLENLAAEAGLEGWDTISDETVLEEDPEWIIYGAAWGEEPPVSEALNETTAVQEGNVAAIDDSDVSQPAPRTVYAIEEIFAVVHSDVHAEIEGDIAALDENYENSMEALATAEDDDETEAETDDETATQADTDETEPADEADDAEEPIPGFGVAVAVAALIALLGLGRRRP